MHDAVRTAPQLTEPATRERLSVGRGAALCSIFFGASVTEAVSVLLLPLTLNLFTDDPRTIFLVLAINPAFGFIAQPLVGVISDRVWTRLGRRAVFLIASAPIVAISLLGIPFIGQLAVLVGFVVLLQFFQDVINGSDQPLVADLVPPEQRTLVLGLVKGCENLGFVFVSFVGMGIVENFAQQYGETRYGLPMYAIAAAAQILFVLGAAFFLNEQPIERQPRPHLSFSRYVMDFFHQPMLPRIAAAYFLRAFARTAVVGSASLFAYKTLGLSEADFGRSWGLMPFIALVLGVPLGLLGERFAKHRVLQIAFATVIAGCCVGYTAGAAAGLTVAALVFGIGDMLLEVTHKAYMSEFYPADLIGQLAGAVNIFYALGRTAALLVVGISVKLWNPLLDFDNLAPNTAVDYRVVWIISAIAAVLGIAILATVRDFRHEARVNSNDA